MMLPEHLKALIADLWAIYYSAGQEVTYVAASGKRRAYWPNRYRQALQRAISNDDVLEFVERVVTRDDATRGFGYLQDAGRLDLTVEHLVADEDKPYHGVFSEAAIEASKARLAYAASAAGSTQSENGNKLSSKAREVLAALTPIIGGSTEIPALAETLATFEGDGMTRSTHVLAAAETYMRRSRIRATTASD